MTLSPFGPKVLFGRNGLKEVGWLNVSSGAKPDLAVNLMLPESAIPSTATSLANSWKHLHISTFDEAGEGAGISSFWFSAGIHPNLSEWADAD